MQALRVNGNDRIPRLNHTDPSERPDDAPALVGVEYPLALVEWHDACGSTMTSSRPGTGAPTTSSELSAS